MKVTDRQTDSQTDRQIKWNLNDTPNTNSNSE